MSATMLRMGVFIAGGGTIGAGSLGRNRRESNPERRAFAGHLYRAIPDRVRLLSDC